MHPLPTPLVPPPYHHLPSQVDPEDHDSWFVLVFSPSGGSLEEARTHPCLEYIYDLQYIMAPASTARGHNLSRI